MVKQRLIFTLLMQNSTYMLSRNFSLQVVGDIEWLRKHYHFEAISFSIDELIVLNVERGKKDIKQFAAHLIELSQSCFMPIAAGGGIRSIDHAYQLLDAGCDKLIINSPLISQEALVRQLVKTFGSQCLVASIDYLHKRDGSTEVYIVNGSQATGLSVEACVRRAHDLGCGEIYLTSIDRDGTGQGYDLELIKQVAETSKVPVIASGGVGKYSHLADGVTKAKADAVSTANIFNFIEDGLTEARLEMQARGIRMAVWDQNFQRTCQK